MKLFERFLAIVLIVMLVLLVNPFPLWMPAMSLVVSLAVVAALFCVWAGFVLHEKATDEREDIHRSVAARIAFMSGAAVLTLALLFQGLMGHIDPWIPSALAVMIATKVLARIYTDHYR